MTLSSILDGFRDHDWAALSLKAHAAAEGCGLYHRHPMELTFEDWELLSIISGAILDAETDPALVLDVYCEFYCRFPGYDQVTQLFRWHDAIPDLPERIRGRFWDWVAACLDGPAFLADPVRYSLWVDRFEDPRTQQSAWQNLVCRLRSEVSIRRLLDASGPISVVSKIAYYESIRHRAELHHAILRSLYVSAHDVFGQFERESAQRVLDWLVVDRASAECIGLLERISAEQVAPPKAGS